jgi:flagellar protein FliO/FliZ
MDPSEYLRFAAALIFVLALLGAFAFAARAMGFLQNVGRKPGSRRLSTIESLMLDARRRVVIVRRDGKEHVILLGPNSETVLEGGIDVRDIPDPELSPGASFVTIKTEPRP